MQITYKKLRGRRELEKTYATFYTQTLDEEKQSEVALAEKLVKEVILSASNAGLRAGKTLIADEYQTTVELDKETLSGYANWHFGAIIKRSEKLTNLYNENTSFFEGVLDIAVGFIEHRTKPIIIEKAERVDERTFDLETNNALTNYICNYYKIDQVESLREIETRLFDLSDDGTY